MINEELIRRLKAARGQFVSGEELSRVLGVSRTAIWKHVEELRQAGYRVEAVRKAGYRLVAAPDRLYPVEVQDGLKATRFGREVVYFDAIASTQIEAHRRAEAGAPEGLVVAADVQTGGRGRLGRTWHSPPDAGIWMSLVLRPEVPLARVPQLTLVAAVSLADTLAEHTGLSVGIKWPNDLFAGGRKVCGILTELAAEADRVHFVILGIGLNVNQKEEDFPPELRARAGSLAMAAGRSFSRVALTQRLLEGLETDYDTYLREGFAPFKRRWEARAISLGRRVVARTPGGEFVGVARGIDDDGALLLEQGNGTIRKIYSADLDLHA
ncbi:MAG: biotin--[acetyl-CoA-carboxylase] ligase [Bacillota bacterium]|nr:biotin--[acetyl-CoA-carboxylase] ligase [Bacillota bacterium]